MVLDFGLSTRFPTHAVSLQGSTLTRIRRTSSSLRQHSALKRTMVAAMKTSNRCVRLAGAVAVLFSASVLASSSYSSGSSQQCTPDFYADGDCDEQNNREECGNYDGGDCCSCTCVDTDSYICGENGGFACIDPTALCVDDDDVTIEKFENCGWIGGIGNGFCDTDNNNALCDYDGGDCCSCTCVTAPGDDDNGCRDGFQCIDPAAECVNDDDITVDQVENCGYVAGIGNGYCNEENNLAECNYDGGDCCECTCVAQPRTDDFSGDDYYGGCGAGFSCIDPSAPCVDDDDITIGLVDTCDTIYMSNAFCDEQNNSPECNYDGGDCCSCTCVDTPNQKCGQYDGFACIDPAAQCVNDDDITVDMLENCQWVVGVGNGYCDPDMNIPECNYDGGDCCECTCDVGENGDDYSDGRYSGCNEFACIDPEAPCVDDDSITIDMVENCGYVLGIGNGYCDNENNFEACNFDGGDCCSCTCEYEYEYDDDFACSADGSGFDCKDPAAPCIGEERTKDDDFSFSGADDFVMSYEFIPWEQEGPLPSVDGAVEVGTKTDVGVSATAYDVRPGASSGMAGCGEAGCAPDNTRDGIASEIESRWSCATTLVIGEGPCQIEYMFAEPQDIVDIQVAFWKGNERVRTLEVHLDGVQTHTHESYAGSTFNTLGVSASGVSTVTLESVGLLSDEWISLIEVLIFVTP